MPKAFVPIFLALTGAAQAAVPLPDLAAAAQRPETQHIAFVQQGDYLTTEDNCTYRRTQAPGYPPMWILVLNPHHIGAPPAHRRCPGTL
jgi:hypothetical protein